ncbi:MAG: EAL domain-containing protein [Alphaproteobacteria bacterium]
MRDQGTMVGAAAEGAPRDVGKGPVAGAVVLRLIDFELMAAGIGAETARRLGHDAMVRIAAVASGHGAVSLAGESEYAVSELPPGHAESLAGRLAAAFAEPFSLGGTDRYLRAAIGFAEGAEGTPGVIADAQLACRLQRVAAVAAYEPRLRAEAERQLGVAMALHDAVASRSRDIQVAYQPIFALPARRLVGFEALARWTNATHGEISPSVFVPIAESTGLARPFGAHVYELAVATATDINALRRAAGMAPLTMSVNVSAMQFGDPLLVDMVGRMLRDIGGDPATIRLELTESVLLPNIDAAIAVLERLRALGVAIILDDFGTGYSSFGYLHELPIDGIKLGRSFVRRVPDSQRATVIVGSLIDLAHGLDLSVVAEGVETEDCCRALADLGCDYVQGMLLGRPMPRAAALDPAGVTFAGD